MPADESEAAFRSSPLLAELAQIIESGDLSVLDTDAKRHHFVPQLLLRGFANSRGKGHGLYQLDVSSGAPALTTTERAASRRHFYSVEEEDGSRSNRLEGFLARVESHAAPALAGFLQDPEALLGR
jgi:VCBS repeat-containing protein